MKDYLLYSEEGPDLQFKGQEVASVSSNDYHDVRRPRWTELVLYRTEGGNYISENIGKSSVPGEVDRATVKKTPTQDDVKEFFGDKWLAKYLYDDMGWNVAETVD